MLTIDKKFSATGQTNVMWLMSLADIALEATRLLTELNLQTSRAFLSESAHRTKRLMSVTDTKAHAKTKTEVETLVPFFDTTLNYGRGLYSIGLRGQEAMLNEWQPYMAKVMNSTQASPKKPLALAKKAA